MLVPETARKCVGYLCYRDSERNRRYLGSCLFFSISNGSEGNDFKQITITARHIIDIVHKYVKDGKADPVIEIRTNLLKGGVGYYETNLSDWLVKNSSSEYIDLSVFDGVPKDDGYQYSCITDSFLHKPNTDSRFNFGVGDEVFISGLFAGHIGNERNLPIIRIGNIAMMPEEKIYTNKYGYLDGYLIEARSIGGLSGSPVFVHLSGPRRTDTGKALVDKNMSFIFLLGIIHGHYDIGVPKIDHIVGFEERVNQGIAIVTPIEKLFQVITINKSDSV